MENVGKLGLTVSDKVVQTKHGQNKGIVSIIYAATYISATRECRATVSSNALILPRRIMYFVKTYPFRVGHDMP